MTHAILNSMNSLTFMKGLALHKARIDATLPDLKAVSLSSPLGKILAIGDEDHLYFLGFEDQGRLERDVCSLIKKTNRLISFGSASSLTQIAQELDSYFKGTLRSFKTPFLLRGTLFQNRVWQSLRQVSFGKTMSYQDQTRQLGQNKAYRAVGNANGRNPFIIMIPCHRIIASDGTLGGFSAGLDRKAWLIDFERLCLQKDDSSISDNT